MSLASLFTIGTDSNKKNQVYWRPGQGISYRRKLGKNFAVDIPLYKNDYNMLNPPGRFSNNRSVRGRGTGALLFYQNKPLLQAGNYSGEINGKENVLNISVSQPFANGQYKIEVSTKTDTTIGPNNPFSTMVYN